MNCAIFVYRIIMYVCVLYSTGAVHSSVLTDEYFRLEGTIYFTCNYETRAIN